MGEETDPTTLGAGTLARRRTYAGDKATSAMVENFTAGDYVILKTEKDGKFNYCIMLISNLFDDSNALVESENVPGNQVL